MDFVEFPKIARLSREVIVTEKIDGTNVQIVVADDGNSIAAVGSRNRFITPEDDNAGFAHWVHTNAAELVKLGPGSHFGEWWGAGIGRKYDLKEKRFSLFNVSRWGGNPLVTCPQCTQISAPADVCSRCKTALPTAPAGRPSCCDVVPELWRGNFDDLRVDEILAKLHREGSVAAPGYMKPEGVVIFHTAGGHLYKKTFDKNDQNKWMAAG